MTRFERSSNSIFVLFVSFVVTLSPLHVSEWRTARITRSEELSNHCPRDTRGLGVHPLVRWFLQQRISDHRTKPLARVYRAHHHAPNASAHLRAGPLSSFVSFVSFAVATSTAQRSARRERITTAKGAKYAKAKETATINLNRDQGRNPATGCISRRETAIKEDVANSTSRASITCPAHDVSAEIILHPDERHRLTGHGALTMCTRKRVLSAPSSISCYPTALTLSAGLSTSERR